MDITELKKLVEAGEHETFEYKESTGQRVDACETLCAFLNGDGGMVVFGVTRKGKLTGQLVSDETRRNLLEVFDKFEPAADIETEWVRVDETHQAIVCRVTRRNVRPYVYDGRPYKRVQSSTTVMTQEEYNRMLSERGGFISDWELQSNPHATMDDINADEVLRTAKMAVSVGRLDASVDITDPKVILKKFRLMDHDRPMNGAMVLFGKDLTYYPQCYLKAAKFAGTTKEVFDDVGIHECGNFFELFDKAMAFCFKHLKLRGEVKGKYREEMLEVPADALRESVINAMAHRLYTSVGGSVSIAIYDDRVEISNPGNFPPELPLEKIREDHGSFPRNPRIADVLFRRKTIEAWGRGINLIYSACVREGKPLPTITCDGHSVKTVYKRQQVSQNCAKLIQRDEENSQKGGGFSQSGKELVQNGEKMDEDEEKQVQTGEELILTEEEMIQRTTKVIQTIEAVLPTLRKDARANAERVLLEIALNPYVKISEMSIKTAIPQPTIKNALGLLRNVGILYRIGGDYGGHWMISWKDGRSDNG